MTLTLSLLPPQEYRGTLKIVFAEAPEEVTIETAGKEVGEIRYRSESQMALVSLGKKNEITAETFRRAGGALARWLRKNRLAEAGVDLSTLAGYGIPLPRAAFALSEGLLLGDYRFLAHKSKTDDSPPCALRLLAGAEKDALEEEIERAQVICQATNLAREWANQPANVINPVTLAERVQELAAQHGLKCTVLDDRQLTEMGAQAIVAVGQGSETPSRLIILEYAGRQEGPPIALVGKTITFDTGGYAIKSTTGMLGMKFDKSGGMAVIATLVAAARLRLTTPLIGLIAAAENMISGRSYRPGDIVKTLSGKTVEVVNPDAEGRLVMADALTYAQRQFHPRALVDIATLTGGSVIALGRVRASLMSNDDDLATALLEAGERVHERLWRMPLDEEYFRQIKGEHGDIKNSGGRVASPITAAVFLKQFIEEGASWAHLDIAGVAHTDEELPYGPKGATGFGVRLFLEYLQTMDEQAGEQAR